MWQTDGVPKILPVVGSYEGAVANGFNRSDDEPLGVIAPVGQSGGPPIRWTSAGPVELPAPEVTGSARAGNGTTIVGITRAVVNGQSFQRATYWQDGTFTVLSIPLATHSLTDINASGVYVGGGVDRSDPANWRNAGFYGQGTTVALLSDPDFPQATPAKINDHNWMGGAYRVNGYQRPFVSRAYTDEIYALTIPAQYHNGYIAGINNSNDIIGSARGDFDWQMALLWPNGQTEPININDLVDMPDVTLIRGLDINNAGQMLVEARFNDGSGYAYYRLDPVPEPAAAVVGIMVAFALSTRSPRRSH